jgi:hypothetical protein
MKGLARAQELYKKGGDAVEAYLEGAGVAITATAKTLVDTSEMAYKVIMSRPSRFIGRNVLKGAKKLGEKLFGE